MNMIESVFTDLKGDTVITLGGSDENFMRVQESYEYLKEKFRGNYYVL